VEVRTRLRRTGRLLVLAVLLAVGGCREPGEDVATSDGAPTSGGTDTRHLAIASVDPPTGNTIVVRTVPTVAEEGPGDCHGTVRSDVVEGPESVLVTLELTTPAAVPYEGCALEPRSITITLSEMPDELRISDSLGGHFAYVNGRYEGCPAGPMICNTDPASCDNATLHDAIANADVPAHFDMPLNRCEPPFAVVDVDYGSGACAPTGEAGPNPCAGQRIHRMYWQILDDAWGLIGYDDNAGCAGVLALEPDFPTTLCADLPALDAGEASPDP
jgi:hypothetical protein